MVVRWPRDSTSKSKVTAADSMLCLVVIPLDGCSVGIIMVAQLRALSLLPSSRWSSNRSRCSVVKPRSLLRCSEFRSRWNRWSQCFPNARGAIFTLAGGSGRWRSAWRGIRNSHWPGASTLPGDSSETRLAGEFGDRARISNLCFTNFISDLFLLILIFLIYFF